MRRWRALRAAARAEWRQLRRHAGRSWLVVFLIAVPVAALAGGGALHRTTRPSLEERRAALFGQAQWRVRPADPNGTSSASEILRDLPVGTRATVVWAAREPLSIADRTLETAMLGIEVAPGTGELDLARGFLHIVEGRMPTAPNEVALSPALLAELALDVGEQPSLDFESCGRSGGHEIVGIGVRPEELDLPFVLLHADVARQCAAPIFLLASTGASVAELDAWAADQRRAGHDVASRDDVLPDPFESIALFVVGGFGFFEAALVVAAAFAVSLRRRQREIGLLGANGATIGTLRTAVILSACGLSLLGITLGVATGVGVARALHPWFDGWNGRLNGPFELSSLHTLGAVVLGLAATVAATAWPAHAAARLPIRTALGGRRPITTSSRVWAIASAVLVGTGLATMAASAQHPDSFGAVGLLAGAILAVAGLGTSTPWVLSVLARGAGRLPLAWRLAVRDAGRFRSRNGPVVTAVLAGVSIEVLVASTFASVAPTLPGSPESPFVTAVLAVCLVTGLVIVLVATALSAAESVSDARTLHDVGASRAFLRSHLAARAAYLAGLGCLLAVPAGLLPLLGLVEMANRPVVVVIPWLHVAGVVLALPSIAFAMTWLFGTPRRGPHHLLRTAS